VKCPWCGSEMEMGVIQSPNEISWQKKSRLFGKAELHPDSVLLAEHSFIKGSAVAAGLCRNCRKVVIDYGDNDNTEE